MSHPTPSNVHAELVPQVVKLLSTRTLQQFAEEARVDGESLRDLVDRYDIDYAWHVLGSKRLLDAAVAELEARLRRPLLEQQRGEVAAVLGAAAADQAVHVLMSFDNDLAPQLAELMIDAWASEPSAQKTSADVA
jgi:hypothetical protein